MEICEANEQHIPAIQAIYAWHVVNGTATFETEPPDAKEMSARLQKTRAAGFAFTGTLKSVGLKHGRWLDTVIMQRAVGESDNTFRALIMPAQRQSTIVNGWLYLPEARLLPE